MGYVVSINSSADKGEKKTPRAFGMLVPDGGLLGDAHRLDGHRQLSLLAHESIDEMTAQGIEGLGRGSFAENITTRGIELHTLPVGTRLKIGHCVVEITQIGKQCHNECEIFKRVGKCVMPQKGVFARVLQGGEIYAGDEISIEREQ